MAMASRPRSGADIDIRQIISEAQTRWLRPLEVCEILQNFAKYGFKLNPVPPVRPISGSMFLFDRKTLRYFRKDGHNWRKKKDGKTVREAHERLKIGSVDILHCYYAHGEENPSFQRRCYWLLDAALEHIVLVHYREVTEGGRFSMSDSQHSLHVHAASPPEVSHPAASPESYQEDDSPEDGEELKGALLPLGPHGTLLDQITPRPQGDAAPWPTPQPRTDFGSSGAWFPSQSGGTSALRSFETLLDSPKPGEFPPQLVKRPPFETDQTFNHFSYSEKASSFAPDTFGNSRRQENLAAALDIAGWRQVLESTPRTNLIFSQEGPQCGVGAPYVKQESMSSSSWADMLEQVTTPTTHRNLLESLMSSNQMDASAALGAQGSQSQPSKGMLESLSPRGPDLEANLRAVTEEKALKNAGLLQRRQRSDSLPFDLFFDNKLTPEKGASNEELRKSESFGRWMSQFGEFSSAACFQPGWPMTPSMGDDIYSVSHQVHPGMGAPEQRFSITDFSPEWAYASEGTKVLVMGEFLGACANGVGFTWCCMFGSVEVPAEVVGGGGLRCKAPAHAVGKVPFYVTSGDRQCRSEIRQFEYRGKAPLEFQAMEERLLKVRLSRLLLSESGFPGDVTLDVGSELDSTPLFHSDGEWLELEALAKASDNGEDFQERLLQMLLKIRMQKWLLSKVHEEGRGASVLDAEGEGVLHMAAALGYDWVVAPMVAAGVPINFRDARGWTALHWAAWYGKEHVVITLLGHGADPGTVTDPTPSCPAGQTPADLASMKGHAGIGGFLAESSLTRRLSSMTLLENPDDIAMSQVVAETAVAKLSRRESVKLSISGAEDQDSIYETLQAVRNAARAAALIQVAFRQHSFRKREEDDLASSRFDEYGMTQSQMNALLATQRIQRAYRGHQEKKQQLAASRIQQKFRSWKVRRDFLKFRQRVVRIQAQVRGNLVRKRFKKLLWSVGVLEKLVLRWKRKRQGLRGFKSGSGNFEGKEDDEEFLKEGRKQAIVALEKSVTRVQSMVRSRQARAQYRRLREGSLRSEQAGQVEQLLSEVSSPQDLLTSVDAEFQYYGDSQFGHIYLETDMNFTD